MQRSTGDMHTNVLENEPTALIEHISLNTRRQMYYQHNGAYAHLGRCSKMGQTLCIQAEGINFEHL
jgi:hypothetical protein